MKEFLQPADRQRVEDSITLTRRMRAAGAKDYTEGRLSKAQEVLGDAEVIAQSVAGLLVCRTADLSLSEPRELVDTRLGELSGQYNGFEPVASHGSRAANAVYVLERIAEPLGINWEKTIDNEFRVMNMINLKLKTILSSRVGVISPLTTDYFAAMLQMRFVQDQLKRECFDVKPAIIELVSGRFTGLVVLPESDGEPVFSGKDKICIFVDDVWHGTSAYIVDKAV